MKDQLKKVFGWRPSRRRSPRGDRQEKASWWRPGRRRSLNEGPIGEGLLEETSGGWHREGGLAREGLRTEARLEKVWRWRLQHTRGECEAVIRVCEKWMGKERPFLPTCFWYYIGLGFTCHSNGSNMGLFLGSWLKWIWHVLTGCWKNRTLPQERSKSLQRKPIKPLALINTPIDRIENQQNLTEHTWSLALLHHC
jgi:hypothetical protein